VAVKVVPSRLKAGRLLFGGDFEYACHQSAVRLTPKRDTVGSDVTTICGKVIPATVKTSYTLSGDAVSDFNDPAGFQLFAHTHASELWTFEWAPNVNPPTYYGVVRVQPIEIGGEVGARLKASWSWTVEGAVSTVAPVVSE
jgi:hypothetical protein